MFLGRKLMRKSGTIIKRAVLSGVGLSALAMGITSSAVAQDTTGEEVREIDEVIAVGIRSSLEQAVALKRSADNVADFITAEDIGEFPDENLAESLQRVTGVQINRTRGEGEGATIRGLPRDFTLVQYNGRALPSATGNRSFDFTILSSEFVRSLEVHKSPTAGLTEGGIAGSINVQTVKPLAVGERKLTGSIFGQYDENSEKVQPKVSALYTDVSADGRFGVSVGGVYSKREIDVHNFGGFGLEQRTEAARDRDFNTDNVIDPNDDTVFAFNHATNFNVNIGTRERISGILAVQYEVSDSLELYADGLYSSFEEDGTFPTNSHRFTNISPARAGDPSGIVSSTIESIGGFNVLTRLDADSVDDRNNNRRIQQEDELYTIAAGANFDLWDNLSGTAEVAYSESERITNSVGLEVIGRASVEYDTTGDFGGIPNVTYTRGYDALDPNNLRAIGINGNIDEPINDEIFDAKLDFDWDVSGKNSFVKSVGFGAKYTDRSQFQGSRRLFVGAEDLAPLLGETFEADVEGGSFNAANFTQLNSPDNFLDGYSGDAVFPTTYVSADSQAVLDVVSLDELVGLFGVTEQQSRIFTVDEETLALYAQANFGLMNDRLTGNVGVRYIDTEQSSSGNLPDLTQLQFTQQGAATLTPVVTPQTVTGSYTEFLPNLNLRFDVTPDVVARFSAARVMSRAALQNLSPATAVNLNVGTLSRSNPDLSPQTAEQFDFALEWYLADGGLLSGTFFSKDLTGAISTVSGAPITLSGTILETNEAADFTVTPFFPDNSDETINISGFEVSYQQPLTFLPAPFDGFGVIANYTYVDVPDIPLDDISQDTYNLVGYYENDKFSTRLAYNYRSGFQTPAGNFFGDGSNVESFGQLDASFNYKINDNFTAVVEGINLTEEVTTRVNDIGFNRGVEDTGRRVIFGVRATF